MADLRDEGPSRLRGMASDPRNVRDMRTLAEAAAKSEEHGDALTLLRDMAEELEAVSKQVPDHELLRSYLKRGTLARARALLVRVEARARG